MASCSLKETSYSEIEKNQYMRNPKEAESVLLGVYHDMVKDALYGFNMSIYFPLTSDEAKVEGSSTNSWRDIPCNAYTSNAAYVEASWAALYNAVYDANDFIERLSGKLEEWTGADRQLGIIYMAEARALRALYNFELLRWWGNIVLMKDTKDSQKHPSTFVQAAPADVYRHIEEDLKYAVSVLPYASEDTYRASNAFRISKGGALGLLTKVYATWAGYPVCDESKWADAAATAKVLITSQKHDLLSDFVQLWKNSGSSTWDATESLIEVSFYAQATTGQTAFDPVGRIGKWNGVTKDEAFGKGGRVVANWRVHPTFLRDWAGREIDKRWALSYADYTYDKNGYKPISTNCTFEQACAPDATASQRKAFVNKVLPGKWDVVKYVPDENVLQDQNFSNVNWYLLRYADVLLLYAEAINESLGGPNEEAYAAINKVRGRAGVPNLTGLSYEEFQKAVRDERAHELAFEGHRRQDLTRWGIYYETIKKTWNDLLSWHEDAASTFLAGEYTVKGKHELLPIPLRDLDLMQPGVKQNPQW